MERYLQLAHGSIAKNITGRISRPPSTGPDESLDESVQFNFSIKE